MQRGGARAMKAQAKREAVKVIPQSTIQTSSGLITVKAYTRSNGIQVKATTRKRPANKATIAYRNQVGENNKRMAIKNALDDNYLRLFGRRP